MANNNQQWVIDDGSLRIKAEKLIQKYPAKLQHVDLSKIMFCRLVGGKVSWSGKCWSVQPPWNLLTMASASFGVVLSPEEQYDIKYIIALNDVLVRGIFTSPLKEVAVLLHELLHVRVDMEGCERHDIEDFAWMLHEFGIDWGISDSKLKEELSDIMEYSPEGVE
jgi:hypothetical protein